MSTLPKKTSAPVVHVQARAGSISLLLRGSHANRSRQRDLGDADERVMDELGFQLDLSRVLDVRKQAAAAQEVGRRLAPIETPFDHIDGNGVRQLPLGVFDA